ncbi:S-adenosylmethionine decarboxylase proenzyme-like isoform X2 [Orbicella faveolata]|uniref:S-adenosylmethionine decarboxylase proenzyme-like isoform X2 n=1 Tax=Orbicella faveolata TaxID=48498 RepID=UPI0009E4039D|nr:S-adenosylmethionine decarboxylase proenzyme-like isoform X2 [Orbicella faveolata]
MESAGFFEGPEKLMEVWWTPILGADSGRELELSGDLRTIPREKWSELLMLVNCTIISEKRNDDMIAFLLSESSMFVSRERLILKTCGQTTLLHCIKPLLELAKVECGLTEVQDFFYSRMNYQEPSLQPVPHQTFQQEVKWLDQLFSDGACYALGRLNGSDTWYLYTLHNILPGVTQPDQTLEILMLDLDREVMNKFYKTTSSDADEVTQVTGISGFLPGAVIDAALFDPCGYSANGLLDDSYFSIHITPQEECSYVSFETNVKVTCYKELISKVLDAFKPGRFFMTLFANEGAPCGFSYKTFQEGSIPGYKRNDLQLSQMKMYNLTYGHYEKIKESKIS